MKIRRATEHELLELWEYESIHTASINAKFFCDNIKKGIPNFGHSTMMEHWLESCMFFMNLRTKILQMAKELHIFVHSELEKISVGGD